MTLFVLLIISGFLDWFGVDGIMVFLFWMFVALCCFVFDITGCCFGFTCCLVLDFGLFGTI